MKILGGLLALVTLALAGLYLWLGTAAGADFVYRRLKDLAAAQGFGLEARTFEGPLPGRLKVQGLLLSDAQGPFFRAENLETSLALAAFPRGLVRLPLLRLAGAELSRPPEIPASSDPEPPAPPPLRLVVDKIEIAGAGFPARLLDPAAVAEKLVLDAAGNLSLGPARLQGELSAALGGLGPAGAGPVKLTAQADFDLAWTKDDPDPDHDELSFKLEAAGLGLEGGASRRSVGPMVPNEEGRPERLDGPAWAGRAALHLDPASPWLALASERTGLPPEAVAGVLDLKLELEGFPDTGFLKGSLLASSPRWLWPEAVAREIVGLEVSDWNFMAWLEGGGGRPWNGNCIFSAGGLDASLEGGGRLDDLAATLNLAFNLPISLPGEAPGLGATMELAGSLKPFLEGTPAEPWRGRLSLWEFDDRKNPAGPNPANLAALWSFEPAGPAGAGPDGPPALRLDDMEGNLWGLNLAGAFSAALPASGPPALAGELTGETGDWEPLSRLLGLDLSGAPARLRLSLTPGEAGQGAALALDLPGLTLKAADPDADNAAPLLALSRTSLNLAAADLFGQPRLDLGLNLGPGRAGGLAWGQGELKAETGGLQGTGRLNLSALAWPGAPAGAAGSQNRLAAEGGFDLAASSAELRRFDLKAGLAGLSLIAPAVLSWAGGVRINSLKAKIAPAGEIGLAAALDNETAKIKAEIKGLPYKFINFFTPAELPEGQVRSLSLDLERQGGSYAGGFALKTSAGLAGRLNPGLELNGRLGDGLELRGVLSGGPGWPASGHLTARLPLSPGADGSPPGLDFRGPLTGRLDFSGPLEPLWRLAGQPDRVLDGRLSAGLNLAGSLAAPRLEGSLRLAGGRYDDKTLGLRLRALELTADLRPDQSLKAVLSGRDAGRGTLSLEGEARDIHQPALKFRGRLKSFKPFAREDFSLVLSGYLGAEGRLNALTIFSDLTFDEGDLNLNLLTAGGSIATLPVDEPAAAGPAVWPVRLDLKADAPGRIRIHGYGLDTLWRGRLQVSGAGRPSLTGELIPVRGWFEPPIFARQFDLESGRIAFKGGLIPDLDLELTNKAADLTAVIKITGSARQPKIKLTSRPPMSQDEVAGRLLFGKSPAAISRFEALQLAAALRDISGFGGDALNPIKAVRDTLNLDVLRLGGASRTEGRQVSDMSGSMAGEVKGGRASAQAENEAVSVEAGKYISDKIYMGMEHGTDGPAVRLEVELSPSIALEVRSSSESSQVGLGWKKDY